MADAATAVSTESFPIGSGTLEGAIQAARQGAADAKEAAAKAWSATGAFLARAVYNTTYAVSYGVVFPLAFVAQAIPRDNAAVRGLIEGAQAASRRADQSAGHGSHIALRIGCGRLNRARRINGVVAGGRDPRVTKGRQSLARD